MTSSSYIYNGGVENKDARSRLGQIIKQKSFFSGEVITLASGRQSDFYFNTKPTMLHPEGASLIALLMLDALKNVEMDMIGGLEMGAVPIASAFTAVSQLKGRPIRAFFVRKQAKGHGTQSLIEGLEKGETMAGKRVVIVEDVTTTGGSALKAADVLKAQGAQVVHVITVLDRQEGAAEIFKDNNLPFTALFGAEEFRKAG